MLVFNGLLAFLQVVVFPGLLVVLICNVRGCLNGIILAFPASLSLNYIFFRIVAGLGLPMRASWFFIIGCELLVFIGYLMAKSRFSLHDLLEFDIVSIKDWMTAVTPSGFRWFSPVYLTVLLNLFLLLYLMQPYSSVFTTTYAMWDDTLNWGRWAANWAMTGSAGHSVYWYPQLGPINRAISYVLMENTGIHFFSKAVMPLFSIWTALMLLNLELRFRNLVFLSAAAIFQVIIICKSYSYHSSGFMDLPVMMLVFASAYPLLFLSEKARINECRTALIFSILAGAAAIWTKQSGLVVFLGTPIAWWWVGKIVPEIRILKNLAALLSCFLIAAISFYIPQFLVINSGNDLSNIGYLQNLNIRDPWFGTTLFGTFINYPSIFTIIFFASIFSFQFGSFSSLCLTSGVLYFAIWGVAFNYDLRNFFFGFPMIALMTADGIIGFIKKYSTQFSREASRASNFLCAAVKRFYNLPLFLILPTIFGVIIGFSATIPDRVLINRQRNANLQMHPGLPVNVILDAMRLVAPDRKVLTAFAPSTTVPESEGKLVYYDRDFSNSLKGILNILGEEQYGFLVYEPAIVDPRFSILIENGLESKEIKVLLRNQNTYLLQYKPAYFRDAATKF